MQILVCDGWSKLMTVCFECDKILEVVGNKVDALIITSVIIRRERLYDSHMRTSNHGRRVC